MTKDETGKKYGLLTVLYDSGMRQPSNRCIRCVCQCECGNYHIANGNHLRFGKIQSCGCLAGKNKKVKL